MGQQLAAGIRLSFAIECFRAEGEAADFAIAALAESVESLVGAVVVTDKLGDATEIYRRCQFAQQMVGGDQLFIDHAQEAALIAVLALHILPHRCHMIIQHLLVTILTEHALDFKSLPCYNNKVGFTPVYSRQLGARKVRAYP